MKNILTDQLYPFSSPFLMTCYSFCHICNDIFNSEKYSKDHLLLDKGRILGLIICSYYRTGVKYQKY